MNYQSLSRVAGVLVLALLLLGTLGCPTTEKTPDSKPTTPTFSGPAYLHGTVGSLAKLRGFEPQLVSGYGLVVNLDGTGSRETPAFLRQWLLQEMRKKGLGSDRLGTRNLRPEAVLASTDTAIVMVEGLIPPGAAKGTPFDVFVSALPQTQTTSLIGGQLWTTDLAQLGANQRLLFSRRLADAHGPIYSDPLADEEDDKDKRYELRRAAVVVAGGRVQIDRRLELIMNQPHSQRVRAMADRINERFPHENSSEFFNTAVAKTDLFIDIHVPRRYAGDPERFLNLLRNMYIQRYPGFEVEKAQQLGEFLVANPSEAVEVGYVWETLGNTGLSVVRRYYEHERLDVRLTALQAGSRLQDNLTASYIQNVCKVGDAKVRSLSAEMLSNLPNNLKANRLLRELADDRDQGVRIAAYKGLARIDDPLMHREVFVERDVEGTPIRGTFKFVLDLVPAKQPLIYVNQTRTPTLVVFEPNTPLRQPMMARIWDNRLMLRASSSGPVEVFYQPGDGKDPIRTHIAPTVANLVYLLAHKPTPEKPADGFDLSFGEVVNAIHLLRKQGVIAAPMQVERSQLADVIESFRKQYQDPGRPETLPRIDTGSPAPDDGGPESPTGRPEMAPGESEPMEPMDPNEDGSSVSDAQPAPVGRPEFGG